MTQLFVNNFSATVAQTFGSTDQYLYLNSVVGLPALTDGNHLLLTLFRKVGIVESGHEVIKVTAITDNMLAVVRATEGAAATLFNVGDRVEARVTAASLVAKADVADAYVHPVTHLASVIEQDASNRFVTDAEKTAWNTKQPAGTYATGTGSAEGVNTGDETLATIKTKLGITTLSGSNTGDQTLPTLSSLGGQAALVSGTNIKTVNGGSLLGAGDIQVSANGAFRSVRVFTTSGTWTKPAGLVLVKFTVVGGGGNAGIPGAANGSGGGGGGSSIRVLSAASVGAMETVTVGGAGGTSSVGTLLSATGGATGSSANLFAAGGVGSSGDINIRGGDGTASPGTIVGGSGGSSIFGGGGGGQNGNGRPGGAFGGGGGGGTTGTMGAGSAGVVIAEEFF